MSRYESLTDYDAPAATPLDVQDLICVSRPYLALEDLRRIAPGRVVATVPIEADQGRQAAVIGIGEVGRHLAILGLCAASTLTRKEGRHAYLARTARVHWLAEPTLCPQQGPLIGHAQAVYDTSRHVRADTRLTDATTGEVLAQMTVGYDVLPYRLLTRLLGEPHLSTPVTDNPYAAPIPLDTLRYDAATGTVSGELHVTADLCQGHFDNHPVLPVAIAASAMTSLVDYGMAQRSPDARWLAGPLTLRADHFARPGQTVTFTATPAPGMSYHCVAQLGTRTIASVTLELVLVDTHKLSYSTTAPGAEEQLLSQPN